jgi:hypothetical protein
MQPGLFTIICWLFCCHHQHGPKNRLFPQALPHQPGRGKARGFRKDRQEAIVNNRQKSHLIRSRLAANIQMTWKCTLLLLVLFSTDWTDAFYEKGSNVVNIKDENQFKKDVLESDFLWAVEFYREVTASPKKLVQTRTLHAPRHEAAANFHTCPWRQSTRG